MNSKLLERLELGSLLMWGSAAWAQTQLTPGVSTLAAPRPTYKRAARENTRVNVSYALQLLGVVIAWAGLLASLFFSIENRCSAF